MPKNVVPMSKTVTCSPRTDRQTDTKAITEYPIRASAFQASACDMSGPTNVTPSCNGNMVDIRARGQICRQLLFSLASM